MERRDFLRTASAAGALTVTGAGAIRVLSTSGTAQLQTNHNVGTTRLTASSDSGDVDDVFLWTRGSVEWRNVDPPAPRLVVLLQVENPEPEDPGDMHDIAMREFTDIPEVTDSDEPYEYDMVGGSVISESRWSAEDFSAPDGETQTTTFPARIVASLNGEEPDAGPSAVARTEVEVEVESTGSGGGGGGGGGGDMVAQANADFGGNVTLQG